jgi:hypothetical protein
MLPPNHGENSRQKMVRVKALAPNEVVHSRSPILQEKERKRKATYSSDVRTPLAASNAAAETPSHGESQSTIPASKLGGTIKDSHILDEVWRKQESFFDVRGRLNEWMALFEVGSNTAGV